jgi:putative ABC transport system permease protein
MYKDYIKIPWKEIRRRKLRSWLTLIGIIIGITAVVSLITLGQGLENAISKQFEALGDDKLFITPKGNPLTPGITTDAVSITEDDLEIIDKTNGVKRTSGSIYLTGRVEFNDLVRYFFVGGMPTDPEERELLGEAQNYKILKGRFHEKGDKFKAVLGYQYSLSDLFGQQVDLGDKILIQGVEFKVIGIMDRIGSPPDDQSVIIPYDTFGDIFGTDDEIGFIVAQTQAGINTNVVSDRIEKALRKHRDLDEGKEDFSVETPQQLAAAFQVILDIVNLVLIGIAGISLLVGGVGIMNTMYTTVLERTKQIGVMKAMGAKNNHIMALFIVESGLYGAGGGLIGITIGIGFAKLVEAIFVLALGPALLDVQINYALLISALSFSFIIGVLSGIAPARKAAKLHPVDALRYE